MNLASETVAVTPPDSFSRIHFLCQQYITNDFTNEKHAQTHSDVGGAFLNVYKIHIEYTDAIIVLFKSGHITHAPSAIILRSMLENLAMFNHLCSSEPKVVSKYLKKISYFENKTQEDVLGRLDAGKFSNSDIFDESRTRSRLEPFGASVLATYDLLSPYVHVAPYITKQFQASNEKIVDGKYNQLQATYVIYSSLLSYAQNHLILDKKYDELIYTLNELANFSNKYTL